MSCIVFVILVASAYARVQAETPGVPLSPGEELAIAKFTLFKSHIWLLGSDGHEVRLTRAPGGDFAPAWSPDGKQIAFLSNREGDFHLYVMDVNDRSTKRISPILGHGRQLLRRPAWSPDGKEIAVTCEREESTKPPDQEADSKRLIRLYQLDGTYREIELAESISDPAWSPDGESLVCVRTIIGLADSPKIENALTAVSRHGRDHRDVIRVPGHLGYPAFSPDGTRIAFHSNHEGPAGDLSVIQIYVVNTDGNELRQLKEMETQCLWPTWSPDGEQIIFYANEPVEGVSPKTEVSRLYRVNLDGSGLRPFPGTREFAPAFKPSPN